MLNSSVRDYGTTSILAPYDGVVVEIALNDDTYGNAVVIQSSACDILISLSGHLSTVNVKVGEKISGWVSMGTMGSTGRSTGEHLQQESQYEGKAVPWFVIDLIHDHAHMYW